MRHEGLRLRAGAVGISQRRRVLSELPFFMTSGLRFFFLSLHCLRRCCIVCGAGGVSATPAPSWLRAYVFFHHLWSLELWGTLHPSSLSFSSNFFLRAGLTQARTCVPVVLTDWPRFLATDV